MNSSAEIGLSLKVARVSKGLTQCELAKLLYVDNQSISRWEHGKVLPSLNNIILLAETLGFSLDDILLNKKGR